MSAMPIGNYPHKRDLGQDNRKWRLVPTSVLGVDVHPYGRPKRYDGSIWQRLLPNDPTEPWIYDFCLITGVVTIRETEDRDDSRM